MKRDTPVCMAIVAVLFATAQARAAVSYTGTLADVDAVGTISFTVAARASVSAQGFGYGGTASAGPGRTPPVR